MIINHNTEAYRARWRKNERNKFNGAFYYSQEICDIMIPLVKTDRNWVTVNVYGYAADHSIVFIHNNLHPEYYKHLERRNDLILVCGIPETMEKVAHLGTPIYLPLSVDVGYVEQFRLDSHPKEAAFVGRSIKRKGKEFPEPVDFIEGLSRSVLLSKMAKYKRVYGVGRVALEAKILGCEVCPYDPRFPDPDRWHVLDTRDAAVILQRKLDEIDGVK